MEAIRDKVEGGRSLTYTATPLRDDSTRFERQFTHVMPNMLLSLMDLLVFGRSVWGASLKRGSGG